MENHNIELGQYRDLHETNLSMSLGSNGQAQHRSSGNPLGGEEGGYVSGRRKRYHRHSPQQVQELENFFKECPHPDEKQRMELSRRLGLDSKQIKFWFQNKRTQLKTNLERHENVILRQQNDKLQAENMLMKETMRHPTCPKCGGPALIGEMTCEEHQLMIENARLKEKLNHINTLADKLNVRSKLHSPSMGSGLEHATGSSAFDNLGPLSPTLPLGFEFGDVMLGTPSLTSEAHSRKSIPGISNNINVSLLHVAVDAMDELMELVQPSSIVWNIERERGKETLNVEYARKFPPSAARKPAGFATEVSRENGVMKINSRNLLDTMMDVTRWAELFPSIVAKAKTLDVISGSLDETANGRLLLIHAEFQGLSHLVPVRAVTFLRYCKQQADGIWAVVDVSIDPDQGIPTLDAYVNCKRLPSGFVVQEMPRNYSKVIWVEHWVYDERSVHHLYRPLLSSGLGFGAQRWLATLQRQCDAYAFLSSTVPDEQGVLTEPGRRSLLKLAQRIGASFCSLVSTSSVRQWDKLAVGNANEHVQVVRRKNFGNPGEPIGIVLGASTSLRLPVPRQQLFDFLRNGRLRTQWDVLSMNVPMQEMHCIPKGHEQGNCISIFRGSSINPGEATVLVLQESWTDASASMIVYAPVEVPAMTKMLNGEDSAYTTVLPGGFAILPEVSTQQVNGDLLIESVGASDEGNGCLLTVGYQVLAHSNPANNLPMEAIENIKNLVVSTAQKIKSSLQVH